MRPLSPRRAITGRLGTRHLATRLFRYTGWPKKVVHFSIHYIFGTVQGKMKRIYQNVHVVSGNKD